MIEAKEKTDIHQYELTSSLSDKKKINKKLRLKNIQYCKNKIMIYNTNK